MSPDRSRSTLLGILALLLVFALGVWASAGLLIGGELPFLPTGGKVGVLPIRGVIDSEQPALRYLERLREDGSVRAFVVEIRTPGGAVGASQSLYREIRELREEDDRPVIAWIGDVGASGGYYVALAADSIYALPGSITGSIGVILQLPNAAGLLRKAGLEMEVVKSGEHKDAGSPYRSLSDSERRVFETLVEDTYGQFLDAVVANRPLPRSRAAELADGSVYSGERAKDLGLVDGIGTLSDAVDRAGIMSGLGEDPPTVRPSERRASLLDLLRRLAEQGVGSLLGGGPGWSAASTLEATPSLLYQWR